MLYLLSAPVSTGCPESTAFRSDRATRTLAQQSRTAEPATAIAGLKTGA